MKKSKTFKQIVLLGIFILGYNISFGQISQGGIPYSFKSSFKRSSTSVDSINFQKSIPTAVMPIINEQVIESIKQNNLLFEEHQFAYGFDVDINIKTTSIIDSLDVGLLYRLSIKSEGAKSINLIFKKYILPKGAKLFIYSKDQQNIIGAFTSNNNKESERLPTLPVFGNEITVEYFEPFFTDFEGQLVIGKVNHDFIGVVPEGNIEDDFGSAGSCMVDINCSEGNNWQTEKRAVCRIVKDGNSHCTGTLLNNTNYDGRPYFLTANHCISTQSEADDCTFIFNYESPSCGGGDGSTSQSIAGATLRATRQQSDFVLLEFSHKPLSSWNPYYAGWDRNDNQGAGGVGIHHPAGDVKKISTYNMTPINSNCISGFPQNNFYLINNWTSTVNGHGVTEGGSSGSALFNDNHQVIGQLYGGCSGHNSNCSDPTNDFSNYGKIFASWDLGGSANNQLQNWLDPANGNLTVLDGANVCTQGIAEHLNLTHTVNSGVIEIQQATKTIISTSTIKSGATVTYEAGQSITLNPGFIAEEGSNFTAKIKDFNCVPGCYPMNLTAWTNIVCKGDNLGFIITNADNFTIFVYNTGGSLIHQNSGAVFGNTVYVWNTTGIATAYYTVTVSFSSECEEISNSYQLFVAPCKKSAGNAIDTSNITIETKIVNSLVEKNNQNFEVNVFPNPSEGSFTISLANPNTKPYSFEISNSLGVVIYKMEHVNVINFNVTQSDFPSGIYYIKLIWGNDMTVKKIIIQ